MAPADRLAGIVSQFSPSTWVVLSAFAGAAGVESETEAARCRAVEAAWRDGRADDLLAAQGGLVASVPASTDAGAFRLVTDGLLAMMTADLIGLQDLNRLITPLITAAACAEPARA